MTQHNPIHGGRYLLRGLRIIFQPGLKRFVYIPMAINLFIYILFIALANHYIHKFVAWIDHFLPSWLQWLNWLLWPFFILMGLVILLYSFGIIASLVTAPFNSFLAEKVEYVATGNKPNSTPWSAIFKETWRVIEREIRKLLYYLPRVIILFVISFIPVINLISSLLWLWLAAWMMAVQYLDYPFDNHHVSFADMMKRLRANYFSNLGFGVAVLFALIIPIFNIVIIPAAVAGATLKWLDEEKQQHA
ncbi:MAG: sulfate transporter CysZ [Pseudomonadota bacterium]